MRHTRKFQNFQKNLTSKNVVSIFKWTLNGTFSWQGSSSKVIQVLIFNNISNLFYYGGVVEYFNLIFVPFSWIFQTGYMVFF